MAATAVGFSLLAGNPVYAAEKSAENFGYEEELRSLFDGEWYASQYPDVVKVYGTDEDALFKHFMTFGINEGRGINTYFDAESYKEANPDLAEVFGDDYAKYYQHYVTFGIDEHRPVKESGVLVSTVKSSNGAAGNVEASLADDEVTQNTVDEKAIQEEYQRLIVEEGIYGKLAKLRQDKKDFDKKYDDFVKEFDIKFDPSNVEEFNHNVFESNINDYNKLKETSEKNHKIYDEKNEEFKKNFTNLLNKVDVIREDEASEAQIKEAYNVANSTLDLAKENKLLASDLVEVDTERLKKLEVLKNLFNGFESSAKYELSRSNHETIEYPGWKYELGDFRNNTGYLFGEYELELAEKAQFWNGDTVHDYMKKYEIYYKISHGMENYMDELYNNISIAKWDFDYDGDGRVNTKYICDCYNKLGEIIESYVPELKDVRLEYESSARCQAYKCVNEYFSQELDKYEAFYLEKYKELEDRHQEVVDRNTAACEEFINENVPKETQEFIDQEVITSGEKLKNAQIEYKSATNNASAVEFMKEEIDEIIAARNIDPSEPTNPDQPDNPSEPTNPDQPDNPGEPTNPNQPKPCYPTKIVIDIDGTITVNIVSEIEASIDFDGHFGIKFQP